MAEPPVTSGSYRAWLAAASAPEKVTAVAVPTKRQIRVTVQSCIQPQSSPSIAEAQWLTTRGEFSRTLLLFYSYAIFR